MNNMNKNRLLVVLVIFLSLGLIGETVYLIKNKTDRKSTEYKSTRYQKHMAENQPASSLPLTWTDQSAVSDFDFWDPFQEMEQIHSRINQLFRDSFSRSALDPSFQTMPRALFFEPDLDINETPTHYILKLDLPGMEKDQINVEVKHSHLVISGERKTEIEESKEGEFYKSERSFGSFSRTVPLPTDANPEDVKAEYTNGVITITVGKVIQNQSTKQSTKVQVT